MSFCQNDGRCEICDAPEDHCPDCYGRDTDCTCD